MGGLTNPPVLPFGSVAGQVPQSAPAQTNRCTDGLNIGFKWTNEGAPVQNTVDQFDNGFVPVGLQTPNGITSRMRSTATINLYTTTSIPALATDRINCFSVYVLRWPLVNPSPHCRFEATLAPSGKVVSVDINPITGVLIGKAGNPATVAVQPVLIPLLGGVENVLAYRVSFALDVTTDTTAVLRVYPRVDGVAAGVTIFGGAQVEGQVSYPTEFISFGPRQAGNIPRQVTLPNMKQRILGAGFAVYNVDPIADQDTWLVADVAAGNTIALPTTGTVMPDMPTGSRLLITQGTTGVAGVVTVQSAGPNTIIAPGGVTAAFTNLTFPSADFPGVTQMTLIKTAVTNQWLIESTSAGGASNGQSLVVVNAGNYGFKTSATAAINTAAIVAAQAAMVALNAAILYLPGSGATAYDINTLSFPVEMRVMGAGNDSGISGIATPTNATRLNFKGVGNAIEVPVNNANGFENLHMSDFTVQCDATAVATATAGIFMGKTGSGHLTKSSFRNMTMTGFTAANAAGWSINRVLETVFENCLGRANYNGWLVGGTNASNTTLTLLNCQGISNTNIGCYIPSVTGTANLGHTFINFVAESNTAEGLYLYGGGNKGHRFINYWSEANNGANYANKITGSVADGSPSFCNFVGGNFNEAKTFDLNYAISIVFDNPNIPNYGNGFMQVSANTQFCRYISTRYDKYPADVTGNADQRMQFISGDVYNNIRGKWREGVAANVPTATATTIFTINAAAGFGGLYRFNAYGKGLGAGYTATAEILQGNPGSGGVANLMAAATGGNLTITLAGQNVQVTQVSGVNQNIAWSVSVDMNEA